MSALSSNLSQTDLPLHESGEVWVTLMRRTRDRIALCFCQSLAYRHLRRVSELRALPVVSAKRMTREGVSLLPRDTNTRTRT